MSIPPSVDAGPEESPEAVAVGARLFERIVEEIDAEIGGRGWMRFSRFMELALYAPGLGYYSAGAAKIGRHPGDGSDFVTAPELTPLFGRALARPVAEVLATGVDAVLELGGGSGRLMVDLMQELERLGSLPVQYSVLEVSADLRERQRRTLLREAPHLVGRVEWLTALPPRIDAMIVGNEVLDALPVELVVWTGANWAMRGVAHDTAHGAADESNGLVFEDRPIPDELTSRIRSALPDAADLPAGYVTEVGLAQRALVQTLASSMSERAVMLLIDYGFPASEYYHPQRATGTLIAHRRHRTSHDVLDRPGSQDITAHVDFTAVADAACSAGATLLGYTSQSSFLIDCGIAALMTGEATDARTWAPQAAALQVLLSESEMGELFKVIAFGRRARRLAGFGGRGREASL